MHLQLLESLKTSNVKLDVPTIDPRILHEIPVILTLTHKQQEMEKVLPTVT